MAKTGKTFDAFNPPKEVTDPQNLGATPDLPAHLYKYGELPGLPSLIVGWTIDAEPITNAVRIAQTAEQLRVALDAGWAQSPVLAKPAKKDKAA
jgi:hypothetical protein